MATSYILTDTAGFVLCAETGDRLVWDTKTGNTAITGLATVSSVGRRIARGQAPIGATSVVSGIGRRLAIGRTAIAASSTFSSTAQKLVTGAIAITSRSIVTAVGRKMWEPEDLPTSTTWTPTSSDAPTWTRKY